MADETLPFDDRQSAGRSLARALASEAALHDAIVLALPRGGVPVAYEIAAALHLPLDLMIVRKLGMPGMEEYAVGAIAAGGIVLMNDDAPDPGPRLQGVIDRERAELARREVAYRGTRPPPDLAQRTVVLVDDGMATGATMRVAVAATRAAQASRVVVAVPVASSEARDLVRAVADDVVCLAVPDFFRAVGCWYRHFDQTGDDEVRELLARADAMTPAPH